MRTLKSQLRQDLSNVFFNQDEFAETHNINGKDYEIIVDSDRMEQRSATSLKDLDELTQKGLLFFIRKSDCEGLPLNANSMLTFDDRLMRVLHVLEDDDMYEVALGQNVR